MRRLPLALTASSTIRSGPSASTTSNWANSREPGALTRARALAPTPWAGPEKLQLVKRWSMNPSWLASTSRNSKTSWRGFETVVETVTGFTAQ